MTAAAEKLKPALAALSAADRDELTDYLMALDGGTDTADVDPAWEAELERRAARVDSGAVTGRPVDDVMRELREKYG